MPKSLLVPITNVYALGGYTAEITIGSQQQTANLILDTGSSSMVVQAEDYDPSLDECISATRYAQNIVYGMGGWYGPVVKTRIEIGRGLFRAAIEGVNIAVAKKEQTGCFGHSDGLLGLAYRELNRAYDLESYLCENNVEPAVTYPWYLEQEQQDDTVREFRKFLKQYPRDEITPYFTQLEEQGVVGNQFAFVIHRSSIYQTDSEKTTAELADHPLNKGVFIMGHPKQHDALYEGQFHELKVLDDKYYNVHMTHMQVGDCEPVEASELAPEDASHVSNAIVDSGASMVVLPETLFNSLFNDLIRINPDFADVLEHFRIFDGTEKGIEMDRVDLEHWPDIHFTFDGYDGESVTLTMNPETYWQTHAPAPNQISFQFIHLESWCDQSILGLPFMNNYFTIFDRAERENGTVMFAEKEFKPYRLGEKIHRDVNKLKSLIEQHKLAL